MRRYVCQKCNLPGEEPDRRGRPRLFHPECAPPRSPVPAKRLAPRNIQPDPLPVDLARQLHEVGRLGVYCSGVMVAEMRATRERAALLWAEHGDVLQEAGKRPFWLDEDHSTTVAAHHAA